jgi:hypothetical protein
MRVVAGTGLSADYADSQIEEQTGSKGFLTSPFYS